MPCVGYLFILAAAAAWALIGPVAKFAFAAGLSPLEVAFFRALLGGAFFALHAFFLRRFRLDRGVVFPVLLFGAVGVAGFYASYQLAVAYGGAALASVLLYTAPAWVAAMGALWLGERLDGAKTAAVAFTLAGVTLLGWGAGGELRFTLLGLFFGLLAGFGYALYYLFGKLYFARYPAEAVYAVAMPVGAVFLFPFVRSVPGDPRVWGVLFVIGFVSTYLAYAFYAAGLLRLEATRASVVATLEPVLASLFAYLWWGERFSPVGYLGAGLVLLAVLLVVFGSRPR